MSGRFVSTLRVIAILGGLLGVGAASASAQCLANELQKVTASDASLGDHFGISVCIQGNVLTVGSSLDDDNGLSSGAAYVFGLDGGEKPWIEQQKLTPADAEPMDHFGQALSMSGDLIVVGSWGDDDDGSNSGSAYVFRYNPDSQLWVQEQKLTASDAAVADQFGYAVSIWGDVAVVGARLDDDPSQGSGSAYVFVYEQESGIWVQHQKLIPSDPGTFGTAVSLEDDLVLIGAPADQDNGLNAGAAYVFRFDPKTQMWVQEQKLLASDAVQSDLFGLSVSLSCDAALIGAIFSDAPGVFNAGAAYVFGYDAKTSQWTEQRKLTASDGGSGDQFGSSVSLQGEMALIGAVLDDNYANGSGSAYIFTLDGTEWNETAKLRYEEVQGVHAFGVSVFSDGEHVIVGANFTTVDGDAEAGAAYIYGGLGDCNENGELDLCDIADGTSGDDNNNGIPDECEPPPCPWDLDGNNDVGVADLLSLLLQWGADPGGPPDFDGNGNVGVSVLLALLANWGRVREEEGTWHLAIGTWH